MISQGMFFFLDSNFSGFQDVEDAKGYMFLFPVGKGPYESSSKPLSSFLGNFIGIRKVPTSLNYKFYE